MKLAVRGMTSMMQLLRKERDDAPAAIARKIGVNALRSSEPKRSLEQARGVHRH